MIDARFSRDAFESLASHADRKLLAAELEAEVRALVAAVPTADGAVSALLSRLRLVGHHLYPQGEGRFAGDAAVPTGLVLEFSPTEISVRYDGPR